MSVAVITLAMLFAALPGLPVVEGQARKTPVLGFLSAGGTESSLEAFQHGLGEFGYVAGKNLTIEVRSADGSYERLPDLARELTRLPVDLLIAAGTPAAVAARNATDTIPIVFTEVAEPLELWLLTSKQRPAANVTGVSGVLPTLSATQVELLREMVPQVSRIGILWNPAHPGLNRTFTATMTAAQGLGIVPRAFPASSVSFRPDFRSMPQQQIDAVIVLQDPMFRAQRRRIVELVARQGLPAMYGTASFVEVGGLMSYGPVLTDLYLRAATYVDRILKGARPADLAAIRAEKFELAVNLTTARTLGLTVSPSLRDRVNRVFE
jgi:putative ABC transport system substrate-binding protein